MEALKGLLFVKKILKLVNEVQIGVTDQQISSWSRPGE